MHRWRYPSLSLHGIEGKQNRSNFIIYVMYFCYHKPEIQWEPSDRWKNYKLVMNVFVINYFRSCIPTWCQDCHPRKSDWKVLNKTCAQPRAWRSWKAGLWLCAQEGYYFFIIFYYSFCTHLIKVSHLFQREVNL